MKIKDWYEQEWNINEDLDIDGNDLGKAGEEEFAAAEDTSITEAKGEDDNYDDYYELDIQSAVDTLTDTGKWYHTSKNGGNAVVNPETGERDTVLSVDKDEDEEEAGYYVFYGRDPRSLKKKAAEVAKRIKDIWGVDIIITPGSGMVEMEIPASIDIKMFQRELDAKKGTKNGRKVKNKKVDVTDLDTVSEPEAEPVTAKVEEPANETTKDDSDLDDLIGSFFGESLTEDVEDSFNENNWLVRNTQLDVYADPNNRDADFEIWPKNEWITAEEWKKFLKETKTPYYYIFKEIIFSYISEYDEFEIDDYGSMYNNLTDSKIDQYIAENPTSKLAQNVKRRA